MTEMKKQIWDSKDCAVVLIDYQPEMLNNVKSSDPAIIEFNVVNLTKAARAFNIPIILSTVGVEMGVNRPTIDSLKRDLFDITEIDRSTLNAWEDPNFTKAVKATKKKRLVFCALYTEICLTYPVLEALHDGFEVSFIADAVGGMSKMEHQVAISRLIQAGAVPNTTTAMICEWFHDWKSPLAESARGILKPYLSAKHRVDKSYESQSLH